MPTSTFFNLPPPKQQKLLQAAVTEFTRRPWGEASINRIVQGAGIPRGSFYQYFDGKQDLFRYILQCFQQQLEAAILSSLSTCGGRLLDMPLTLFDAVVNCMRNNTEEFRLFLGVLRQNAGMDAAQLWNFAATARIVLERSDLTGLVLEAPEEEIALLDLLFSSTGQSLMAACCGKLTVDESRQRLSTKLALIRRGVEKQEEPTC